MLLARSSLWRSPKRHFLTLLILLGAWPGAGTVQAASPGAVVAWGKNDYGQTTAPAAAQSGVIAIAAGEDSTAALKDDGSVIVWGEGFYGQTNVPVAAQSGVTAIAAGYGPIAALKNDGSVVAWGTDCCGEVPVGAQSGVIAIAAGGAHIVALKSDGSVIAWGGTGASQTTVPVEAQSGVVAIAAGNDHTLVLKNDGRVLAWGYNSYGQTNVPAAAQSGVRAIAAGSDRSFAIKDDGTVVAWGYSGCALIPPEARSEVTAIAAGLYNSLVLKANRRVVAWGCDSYGATTVPTSAQGGVIAIAAGNGHSVALVDNTAPIITSQPTNQTVYAGQSVVITIAANGPYVSYQWRRDGIDIISATNATYRVPNAWFSDEGTYTVVLSNFLGSVTSAPALLLVHPALPGSVIVWGRFDPLTDVPIAAQSNVTAIAAGVYHVAAVKNGSVLAWGYNNYGQTTVPVGAQSGVTSIAAGRWHTVALKGDGSVIAWGARLEDVGQARVPTAAQTGVVAVAAGYDHTLALKDDGSVTAWGSEPIVPVEAQSGVIAIAGGRAHTVALKNDGTVIAWGDDYAGETTVPVEAQTGVVAIAAANENSAALKSDGSVIVWGFHESNVLEIPVEAQTGVVAVAIGLGSIFALKSDGTLVSWGDNEYAIPLAAQTNVVALAGGEWCVVALLGDGKPVITVSPVSRRIVAGTNAQLVVMAAGQGTLTYQWQFNGANLVGATNRILDLPSVPTNLTGNFTVIVSNSLGTATSKVAHLDIVIPAKVAPLPASTTVVLGSNVTFSANADGTPPLIYQWRKNGENIPGATNSTYTINNVQVSDGGAYTVVVKNDYGVATSDPTLLIVEVPVTPPGDNFAERVLVAGTNGVIGGTNRFATREAGEPNHGGKAGGKSVWYSWPAPTNGIATFRTRGSVFDTLLGVYTGGSVSNLTTIASDEDLGGFFTSEVRFNAVAGTNYQIAVDGFAGGEGDFVLSWDLEITSDTLPVIADQPDGQAVPFGANGQFSVSANGESLTYQWLFNGTTIPNATNATLVRSNVGPVDVGFYTVRVRNSVGREVESLAATLEIVSKGQPLSQDKLEDLLEPPAKALRKDGSLPPGFFAAGLGSTSYQLINNTSNTTQLHEPNHCDAIGGASRWLGLRATNSGVFSIDTVGSAIDTLLTAYRSTNLLYLSTAQLACDNNSGGDGRSSRIWFNATSNTDYLVVVDGVNYQRGLIQINWAFGIPPSATSNAPSGRTVPTGQSLTLRAPATNGIPPPRFQWFWNGRSILGATNATFALIGLQLTNAGQYTVVVSNIIGTATYTTDVALEEAALQTELELSNKALRIWLPTTTSQTTVVEASTDLQHWEPVYFYAPPQNNFFDLSITNATQQFFRTRSFP